MARDKDKTRLLSEKLYRRLLRLYPKTHREQYGAAMAQAFRDQHRDALREAPRSGWIRLWLRILPDLVKSSFGEHLAALKEREPMLERLFMNRRLPSPRFTFLVIFVAVSLVVFGGSAIVTFMLPKQYFSSARIVVRKPSANGTQELAAYDPYFIRTEFETMLSGVVLDKVVSRLSLNERWGKDYNNGAPLKTSETVELLKRSIILGPVRNTSVIEIKVWAYNPKTAAEIANALAEAYSEHRLNVENQMPVKAGAAKLAVLIEDRAIPNPNAVRPKKVLNLFVGLSVGIFLGLGAASLGAVVSAFIRRKGGKEPPAGAVPPRSLFYKTAGVLWTLLSAILCGLLLISIVSGAVNRSETLRAKIEVNQDWMFILPISLFWGANALLGVLLFLGKSFARICIGVEVLLFVAWVPLAMGGPRQAILRCAFMLGGMFFAGLLLWPRRQNRNQFVPAN